MLIFNLLGVTRQPFVFIPYFMVFVKKWPLFLSFGGALLSTADTTPVYLGRYRVSGYLYFSLLMRGQVSSLDGCCMRS